RLLPGWPVMALTVALTGCGGGSISGPAHGGQGGSDDDTGAHGANGDGDGDRDGNAHGDGDGDQGLPQLGWAAVAPAQSATTCGGCHALNGQPSAYPNLFDYTGSEADFIAQARTGGNGMPAFSADLISDDVLHDGYAFLHDDGERPAP